jgi:hypothetical protein
MCEVVVEKKFVVDKLMMSKPKPGLHDLRLVTEYAMAILAIQHERYVACMSLISTKRSHASRIML